jgi:hypothetical protein
MGESGLVAKLDIELDSDSIDAVTLKDEGKAPRNQANIRSPMDLTRSITLEGWVRYVDRLPTFNVHS